jgi:hypothetical protein
MKRRALFILMLPALVIVAACAVVSSRTGEIIEEHPLGGFVGAAVAVGVFCATVAAGNLLGAWLS